MFVNILIVTFNMKFVIMIIVMRIIMLSSIRIRQKIAATLVFIIFTIYPGIAAIRAYYFWKDLRKLDCAGVGVSSNTS